MASAGTAALDHIRQFKNHYVIRNLLGALSLMVEDRSTVMYLGFLILVLLMGLLGPALAPYQYDETLRDENGEIIRTAPPSLDHPLGTTDSGYDVLSRIMVGAQPTVVTGLVGGSLIIGIGMFVGITAGYVGGRVDDVLMRITDVAYGVPLIPFAIVLVTLIGVGFIQSVVVIGLLLWRGSARVLRSQVLQIKERPFVLSAKAAGASRLRIVVKHILPNVATMAILFFTIGIGYSIILQAGLAFIGVSSPFVPSWGIMLRNAYNSGLMSTAWWWSLPPGLLIGLTVLSTFMFGRGYERVAGQTDESDGALVQGG
jgi:peptide/nickel transport system permease protein